MGSLPDFTKTVTLEGLENLGYSKDDSFKFHRIAWLTQRNRAIYAPEKIWKDIDIEWDTKLKTAVIEWDIRDVYSEDGEERIESIDSIKNVTTKLPGTLMEFIMQVILEDLWATADPMKILNDMSHSKDH